MALIKKLELQALTDNLNDVIAFVEQLLETQDCPMRTLMQIEVAVEEIFVNIAHYAYTPNVGDAEITVEVTDERVARITFSDSGIPYDPLAKPDPDVTLSAQERAIGGLGIYMVKKSMDDVIYQHNGGRNILTLVKAL